MAQIFGNHNKIRLLSLGTGEKFFTKYKTAKELSIFLYIKKMGEFMMNMDTYTADRYLEMEYK